MEAVAKRYTVWRRASTTDQWQQWRARSGMSAWLFCHANIHAARHRRRGLMVEVRPAEEADLLPEQRERVYGELQD